MPFKQSYINQAEYLIIYTYPVYEFFYPYYPFTNVLHVIGVL